MWSLKFGEICEILSHGLPKSYCEREDRLTKSTFPRFETRRPISDLEYVYEALKQSCMNGEFKPGDKITLPQLAEAFGTSQMPIREATNRLIAVKAMEAPPRRSLRIPEATIELLDNLLPLRLLLEGEAARLAAQSDVRFEVENRVGEINAEMLQMAEKQNLKGYLNANQRFHFTLYAAANNPELLNMIELLWMRYGPLMNTVRSDVLSRIGANHHLSINASLENGQVDQTVASLRADFTDASQAIRAALMQSTQQLGEQTKPFR